MPRIATTDELMAYLDVGGNNPARVNPTFLVSALESAENWVENYASRTFAPDPPLDNAGDDTASPVAKTFNVRKRGWLRIPDLRSATAVTINGAPLLLNSDYEFDPYAGSEPYTSIRLVTVSPLTSPFNLSLAATLSITGRWGFSPTPPSVKDAVLTLAARQYRRRDAMFSDIVDTGTGLFEYKVGVPDSVKTALDLYRIPKVAVI